MPLPSIAVPPLNISSVACAATEVTPLKLTVPEAVTRPLMTAVLPKRAVDNLIARRLGLAPPAR